jgi:DNA invertase Pin-like site-specific DNA recombinase
MIRAKLVKLLYAIVYSRASTDEQARGGYSLDQQLEALHAYAALEGYEVLIRQLGVETHESGRSLDVA